MKKSILTLIAFFLVQLTYAQKINITTGMEKLNDEFQEAYNLFVPHVTPKALSKEWASYLKDYKGKLKSSGDEVNSTNAILPMISRDTLQIFARVSPVAEGAVLVVGFQAPAGFISASTNSDESQTIIKLLHDFALPIAKDGLKEKVKAAEKIVESKEKESEEIVKKSDRLRADNEKMQNQINDNERELKDNEKKIGDVKSEIGSAKDALQKVKEKEKDLD